MNRLAAFTLTVILAVSVRAADELTKLTADEMSAVSFLDFLLAPMSAADEKAWWQIGGTQHGIFAKRYSIAFSGYAAAALGQRAKGAEDARISRILLNCIRRYLARDAWAYSQSKSYWGRKPWAPDPCYRENVMYTGHLLHLLAFYERFSGDDRFWREGFDFVWKDGRSVHYDVGKLIRVTVEQMRENVFHGVTCEPGLLFFPCNNHPHCAFRLFEALGHGDWTADSIRWEDWAMSHFLGPAFGGGAINLVYHVKTGLFYPRGQAALDGWSLLWYEMWAADRSRALTLWRRVAEKLDWKRFDNLSDISPGNSCCDPQAVPSTVAAAFLAAAARACDDPQTAQRLEQVVDAKYLRREKGFYFLDLDREWRIGATAHRIISLAEANGARFRLLCNLISPRSSQ